MAHRNTSHDPDADVRADVPRQQTYRSDAYGDEGRHEPASGRTEPEHAYAADQPYADEIRHDDRVLVTDRRWDDAHDQFGGMNPGAAFFGWLVAIAMTVLLTGLVGAVATAVGATVELTQSTAEREAGTIGIVAAAVLATVMLLAYYTGGYVAGRMSRFDGGRQGFGVWLIGLLVTAVAVGVGLLVGPQYDALQRIELPNIPIPTEQLGRGGIITAVVIVVGTALAAMAGGKVGHRYHDKVDRELLG